MCIKNTDNYIIHLSDFHAEFEKTGHNAILKVFPNFKIVCYNFHLG